MEVGGVLVEVLGVGVPSLGFGFWFDPLEEYWSIASFGLLE